MIRGTRFTKGGKNTREAERYKKGKEEGKEEGKKKKKEEIEAALGFTRHVTLMKIAEDEL